MISYSVIWRIFVSFLFGAIIFSYTIENDLDFKKFVERQLKKVFLTTFVCHLEGTVKKIHIFGGRIELEDVSAYALDKKLWQWHAKKFNLSFSWLDFFFTGQFNLKVKLEGLYAQSELKGTDIGIFDHLRRLIGGAPGFPAGLQELAITKGYFSLRDAERCVCYQTHFMLQTEIINKNIEINIFGTHGFLKKSSMILCRDWVCSIAITVKNIHNPTVSAQLQGNFQLPHLEPTRQACSFTGSWTNNVGAFSLYNVDHSFLVTMPTILINKKDIEVDLNVSIPLNFIQQHLALASKTFTLQGVCKMIARVQYGDYLHVVGDIFFEDLESKFCNLGILHLNVDNHKDMWWGNIVAGLEKNQQHIGGAWCFNATQGTGNLEINTTATIKIPGFPYVIPAQAAQCALDFSLTDSSFGTYAIKAVNEHDNQSLALEGTFDGYNTHYKAEGIINAYPYVLTVNLTPSETLLTCSCSDAQKTLFSCATQKGTAKQFEGIIDYQLLQNCTEFFVRQKVPGQGKLFFSGTLEPENIRMKFGCLPETNIRIPGTYNLVRDVQGALSIDLQQKRILISDAKIELDRGTIACNHAVIYLDENNKPHFIYFPCLIKKTLISLHKDIFALISAYLSVSQSKNKSPLLQGSIIIDRAHIKKNIFSFTSQQGNALFVQAPFFQGQEQLNLDITIQTKENLHIKTSFLEANAKIYMTIAGTMQDPHISGSINVERGSLAFPYKPLAITHATIYFLPNQLSDPQVELVAKGTIRNYHIVMRCTGSLKNPHIVFESTPSLTEEQIITLLLAGSEEGSLSLVMPSVLMQSMKNVLFGPEQSPSKLDRYFKNLLGPLRHIRFVPKFFDPQGRGGFRGAIEIDVNDQLHGVIQRNFSLPEDIKLEVEYFFSDDIAVRGIRDERGDLGGEVEMRWKF